jgi:methyl-accepting chemotaxis protein
MDAKKKFVKNDTAKNDTAKTHKKQLRNSNKTMKWYRSIRIKLIAAFILPVCFVILIGSVSYNRASKAIVEKFNESSQQAIQMTGKYLYFGLKSVDTTVVQYIMDTKVQNYFYGLYNEKDEKLNSVYQDLSTSLSRKQISDDFIENLHIMSSGIDGIMSTTGKTVDGLYQEFLASEAGSKMVEGSEAQYWIGKEEGFDAKLKIHTEDYAMRYVRSFNKGEAVIFVDITTDTLRDILSGLNFGTNSVVGIVTEDGRELLNIEEDSSENKQFYQQEFYQKAYQSNEDNGSENVVIKGEDYLYLYSKIGDTGVMICSLIPKAVIVQQVSSIKNLTIILVILASVIAILIGALIATNMQSIIHYIIEELKRISAGNLTVKLKVKSKDEFLVLSEGINDMVDNMRGLIEKVLRQSTSVTTSTVQVGESTEVLSKATAGITDAINEIQMGVNQQAQDSESCLKQMDDLSGKIELVYGKTNEINTLAGATKESISQGIESIQMLNNKAQSTTQITSQVISNIETLEQKSISISKIIATINEIADETNLLSLNASIEAARAGKAGLGFQVVAEEIRKLADQSIRAVKEIEGLIKDIQQETGKAVRTAGKAEDVVKEQAVAVVNTEKSFVDMNHHVELLIGNMGMIMESIHTIDAAREGTLTAIENISAVSQQTAAATLSVSEATSHQIEAVDSLHLLSKELTENALALGMAVDKFVMD